MHIPSSMLNGGVCWVTAAVAATGLGGAVYFARGSANQPSPSRFAAVTALVFALQMLNYPVANGTSGHLVGAVLAVSLLDIPFAVLAMTLVLAVQAVVFADGGVNALGANVLNMALIGAGAAGYLHRRLTARGWNAMVSLAVSAWLSVVVASAACGLEVAWAGAVAWDKVLPAMLSVHALIGAGEALLTVLVVLAVRAAAARIQSPERAQALSAYLLALASALMSPLASAWPDGLEWVAGRLAFSEFPAFSIPTLFADYQTPWVSNAAASTMLAGLAGVVITALVAGILVRWLSSFAART